jgi:hypothetical protein
MVDLWDKFVESSTGLTWDELRELKQLRKLASFRGLFRNETYLLEIRRLNELESRLGEVSTARRQILKQVLTETWRDVSYAWALICSLRDAQQNPEFDYSQSRLGTISLDELKEEAD